MSTTPYLAGAACAANILFPLDEGELSNKSTARWNNLVDRTIVLRDTTVQFASRDEYPIADKGVSNLS